MQSQSVHMKSVVEQGLFHEFAFDNKACKTFIENVTLSNSYSNFVTSLLVGQTVKG